MEKLQKAYLAIDLLKSIDMPISSEQLSILARIEKEYLREEVIPLFEQEITPLVKDMRNSFELEVTFSMKDGLDVTLVDRPKVQAQLFSNAQPSRRQKKYIIRVVFPDNHVSCNHMVWETLVDVVRFAGPERVQQKEVEPGLYVCTYSSTDTKYDQIKTINSRLNLGLKIEKQML